jgi:hypothetical protein
VFTGEDPVRAGLVASLKSARGNATGVSTLATELGSKHLGLLHELAPNATTIVLLNNPTSTSGERYLQDVQSTARSLGKQIRVLESRQRGRDRRCVHEHCYLSLKRSHPHSDPFLDFRPLMINETAAKPLSSSFSAFVITAVPILSLWPEGYR